VPSAHVVSVRLSPELVGTDNRKFASAPGKLSRKLPRPASVVRADVAPHDSVESKEHALIVGTGVGTCAETITWAAYFHGRSGGVSSNSTALSRGILVIRISKTYDIPGVSQVDIQGQ